MFPLCTPPLRSSVCCTMGVAVSDLVSLDSFSVPSLRLCVDGSVFDCFWSSSLVVVAVSVPVVVAFSVPSCSILSLLLLLSLLLTFVLVFLLSSALPGGSSQFLFPVVDKGGSWLVLSLLIGWSSV